MTTMPNVLAIHFRGRRFTLLLSQIKYVVFSSNDVASRTCRVIHPSVGCPVTPTCSLRRLSGCVLTNACSAVNNGVSPGTKSQAQVCCRWVSKNVDRDWPAGSFEPAACLRFWMVRFAT
jgi:hypothetical protein